MTESTNEEPASNSAHEFVNPENGAKSEPDARPRILYLGNVWALCSRCASRPRGGKARVANEAGPALRLATSLTQLGVG